MHSRIWFFFIGWKKMSNDHGDRNETEPCFHLHGDDTSFFASDKERLCSIKAILSFYFHGMLKNYNFFIIDAEDS